MSLLVDLQLVPQRILEKVRAAVLQNREALRHGGIRSRVNQATKQRPQFTKVGATMRDYKAPVPVATGGQAFEPPSLGWVFNSGRDKSEDVILISGNGSQSLVITNTGDYVEDSAWPQSDYEAMRPFAAQYIDTSWSEWSSGGITGPSGKLLYSQQKRLSSVRFPVRRKYSLGTYSSFAMPARSASVYAEYGNYAIGFNYYIIAAQNTRTDVPQEGGPSGVNAGELWLKRYVHAPIGVDPSIYIQNPGAQKWMVVEINGRPAVEDGSHVYMGYANTLARAYKIQKSSITQLTASDSLEQSFARVFGQSSAVELQTLGQANEWHDVFDYNFWQSPYTERADGTIYLRPTPADLGRDEWDAYYLGELQESGIDYPVYTGGVFNYEGTPVGSSYNYAVTPELFYVPTYQEAEQFVSTNMGGFGVISYYSPNQQYAVDSPFCQTPAIYGMLDGTADMTGINSEYDVYNLTASEIIERFQFWPPKFQFLDITSPQVSYEADTQQIKTFAYNEENIGNSSNYYYEYREGGMITPGRPPSHRLPMVSVQDRVDVAQPVSLPPQPQIILTATYGANAYCTERLVELGFDVNDL